MSQEYPSDQSNDKVTQNISSQPVSVQILIFFKFKYSKFWTNYEFLFKVKKN